MPDQKFARSILLAASFLTGSAAAAQPLAGTSFPFAGAKVSCARHSFDALLTRVEKAVSDHRMGVVATASASRGAAGRGVRIPGNAVIMVFRNDFAVRMLEASVAAGFEAPLRYYLTENADGTACLSYRMPSAVFAPYRSEKLNQLAQELDVIFDKIAQDAVSP